MKLAAPTTVARAAIIRRESASRAVDLAHDGLAAAAKIDLTAHDVVVLDRDLPGLHGDTLCQMITERADRAMVLMLTAPADTDGVIWFLRNYVLT